VGHDVIMSMIAALIMPSILNIFFIKKPPPIIMFITEFYHWNMEMAR